MESDVVPFPVKDPHLLELVSNVPKAVSVEFQTVSKRQSTGSLKSAGVDIRHCSPTRIMNPQRVSILWQFANGSFLHSTSWNPFTQPGRIYPWVIINPICGQKVVNYPQTVGYFDTPQYPWDRGPYYWPEHKGTCGGPRD